MYQRLANLLLMITVLLGIAVVNSACTADTDADNRSAQNRPNILFVLTDDQRWDAMSNMNHPFLHTPNIDRLAHEGVRFENAFVTTSLCSPSRASFLTGTYAHNHGVVGNEPDDPRLPIFPELLQQHGYDTAFIGKWHMAPKDSPRPGFNYWLSFRGQGVYFDPKLNEDGRSLQAKGYITDLLTEYALDWLERKRDKPFALILSHKAAHHPFSPAPRHEIAFADAQIPEPVSFQDDLADKPRWLRKAFTHGHRRKQVEMSHDTPVPPKLKTWIWQPGNPERLNYYRTILSVDESLGRVLSALEESGELDSTVVVFAGDNGTFEGEHRLWDKRLAYEESIRIPFLLRFPPMAPGGIKEKRLTLNIDLAPTLLDLVGIPAPEWMEGRSLRPLFETPEATWRDSFLYEYFREGWLPGFPLIHGVRTKRWKYITYPDVVDIEELYDLESDPMEMTNLVYNPAFSEKLDSLRTELDALLIETKYPKDRLLGSPPIH